ncbi:hypothetical protein Scep_005616 [Stephania cephalantha]|uniref:DUF4283 domain-containing protein n=1 Tax=Stephania cephalantha TaxID=152367 RepID=A0AAP0KUP4_9MAGN
MLVVLVLLDKPLLSREESEGKRKGILGYTEDDVVSTDLVGDNSASHGHPLMKDCHWNLEDQLNSNRSTQEEGYVIRRANELDGDLVDKISSWKPELHWEDLQWGGINTWIAISGLPPCLWNQASPRNIGERYGGLLEINPYTLRRQYLQYAVIKVRGRLTGFFPYVISIPFKEGMARLAISQLPEAQERSLSLLIPNLGAHDHLAVVPLPTEIQNLGVGPRGSHMAHLKRKKRARKALVELWKQNP